MDSPPDPVAAVDFRHLSTFKRVYLEKSYTHAAIECSSNRKSILHMMQHLERLFDCELFREDTRGELTPTPFSDRLYNDLRFLHRAQSRLRDHIRQIHETGRVLHIGSSPSIFRTLAFRNLFRELQTLRGIRLSYTAVNAGDAGKALLDGQCDLFIGCWEGNPKRFMTIQAGKTPFRMFCRLPRSGPAPMSYDRFKTIYLLQLEGMPQLPPLHGFDRGWTHLPEKQWLRWLDYPGECPEDTLILAPDTSADPSIWQSAETSWTGSFQMDLHASFLRQHPYEFLPTLAGKIKAFTDKS
ncbi:MAG: LysR family transcriptional regulator [Luteolibacter sp.]